jgi:AmmeMemoRadiSam system protein B
VLQQQLHEFLRQAEASTHDEAVPKALIAPHAGTVYSGPVAASAYVRLAPARARIRRVVLLGPAHRVALRGLAASSADQWRTPLGDVPLDRSTIAPLLALPQVREMDEAHRREHSLEVHVPFLQLVLDEFSLVPLVVGVAEPEEVAEVLDLVWGGDETVVVVSSDLSHFEDYATAKRLDRRTSDMIEQLDFEHLGGHDACGFFPVRGLLKTARSRSMRCDTIDPRNSGDTAGPRREAVGYGSYLFF